MARNGRAFPRDVAAVIAFAVAAGCGPASDSAVESKAVASPRPAAKPSTLIGQWALTGAGAEAGTVVNVSPNGLYVFLKCGVLDVGADARPDGSFLAELAGGSGECFPDDTTPQDAEPAWITTATSWATDGPRRVLLDATGTPVATLTPAPARPTVPSTVADSVANPPRVGARARAAMDTALQSFPIGVRPAAGDELIGLWQLTDDPEGLVPQLWFAPSGRYGGNDGCNNGIAGRWRVVEGQLLWTSRGIMTQRGCTPIGKDHIVPLENVGLVGLDDGELVLLDRDGHETGRMQRAPDQPTEAALAEVE